MHQNCATYEGGQMKLSNVGACNNVQIPTGPDQLLPVMAFSHTEN